VEDYNMFYLVTLSVLLASIFLYLLIELKKSVHLIYIIPLTIAFTVGSYFYLDTLFGYPVAKTTEQKFILLNYHIGFEEDNIYLWVILQEEAIPKAVKVPYSQKMHEQLQQAGEKMKEGKKIEGVFGDDLSMENNDQGLEQGNNNSGGGTNKSKGGAFTLMELDLTSKLPPKNYIIK